MDIDGETTVTVKVSNLPIKATNGKITASNLYQTRLLSVNSAAKPNTYKRLLLPAVVEFTSMYTDGTHSYYDIDVSNYNNEEVKNLTIAANGDKLLESNVTNGESRVNHLNDENKIQTVTAVKYTID
jgi:hypothetical protein